MMIWGQRERACALPTAFFNQVYGRELGVSMQPAMARIETDLLRSNPFFSANQQQQSDTPNNRERRAKIEHGRMADSIPQQSGNYA